MELIILACLISTPSECRTEKRYIEPQQEYSLTTGEHGNASVYGSFLVDCSPNRLAALANDYMKEHPGWTIKRSTCAMSAPSKDT